MKFLKILSLPLLLITMTKCASYKLETNPPFKVVSATYAQFVGGRPESPGGTDIKVVYTADAKITFDRIFYKNQDAKIGYDEIGGQKSITAKFSSPSVKNKDMQMHNDPAKEYGNTPPSTDKKSPFQLKDNEIVISYIQGNKTKYYKVSNLKKGKQIIMQ
ncbi:hypothetical protein [Tenacibaculum amylolyticum]|uniref:hypothetical protein n=1 Tax=Tenacibaculum amylolyticum TaxID=104269 RepID=UPI003892E739